jgi:hypothetical protein
MRSVTLSQFGLIVGIAAGLLALWASAAPTVGPGDSAIGGYSRWYVGTSEDEEHYYVGCSADMGGCRCAATTSEWCGSAYWNGQRLWCSGGYVAVGSWNDSANWTYAGSGAGCYGGDSMCDDIHDALCD